MKPIQLEIKTYEELKEELGNEYDTAMYEINISALKEIERLNNIIKHTDSWLDRTIEIIKQQPSEDDTWILERLNGIKQCLKGDGSNEPSFEEMVEFVENVCKDIKGQPTLHEELEEERKTIAKIVGDFKEVNK